MNCLSRRAKRPLVIIAVAAALLGAMHAVLGLAGIEPVLNLTLSARRGVYVVRPLHPEQLKRGDIVRFTVPVSFERYLYGRGWLRPGMPLLKAAAGMPGDRVCIEHGRIRLSGVDFGPVFAQDSQGLPLPARTGCSTIPAGFFLPMSTFYDRSFDGRYMGAVPVSLITGQAELLWTF